MIHSRLCCCIPAPAAPVPRPHRAADLHLPRGRRHVHQQPVLERAQALPPPAYLRPARPIPRRLCAGRVPCYSRASPARSPLTPQHPSHAAFVLVGISMLHALVAFRCHISTLWPKHHQHHQVLVGLVCLHSCSVSPLLQFHRGSDAEGFCKTTSIALAAVHGRTSYQVGRKCPDARGKSLVCGAGRGHLAGRGIRHPAAGVGHRSCAGTLPHPGREHFIRKLSRSALGNPSGCRCWTDCAFVPLSDRTLAVCHMLLAPLLAQSVQHAP